MRVLVCIVALAGACSCSSRLEATSFKEQVQELASIAAEGRLLLALRRDGKVPPTFFRTHSEALADRTSEHLAELTRRETDDRLLPKQREAIDRARELSDVLRPLPERADLVECAGTLARLEKAFDELEAVR